MPVALFRLLPMFASVWLAVASCAACSLPKLTEWRGFSHAQHVQFLKEFWQREPLLIRSLLSAEELESHCPLRPHEVVEMALEPDARARIIQESGGKRGPWQLSQQPFDDSQLQDLYKVRNQLEADADCEAVSSSRDRWTVLIQEVDQHTPEVEALRERFSFVPRWRVDDVMVSYAPPGGSVGAHLDSYDVFLVQGSGTREWSIESQPRALADEQLKPGLEVRCMLKL